MNRLEYNEKLYSSRYYKDHLAHHGIIGQKWGVRRFQNEDGSLTSAGRKRYLNPDGSIKSDRKADKLADKAKFYDKYGDKLAEQGRKRKAMKNWKKSEKTQTKLDEYNKKKSEEFDEDKYNEYQKQQYKKLSENEREIQDQYTEIKDIIESDDRINPEKQNYNSMSEDKRIDITKKAYKAEPLFDTAGDEREVDDGDAFWFFCEDQTIGCGAVAAMLYDGVPVSKVKKLLTVANRSSFNNVDAIHNKVEDMYGEEYARMLWELREGNYGHYLEDFADKFDKVLHE